MVDTYTKRERAVPCQSGGHRANHRPRTFNNNGLCDRCNTLLTQVVNQSTINTKEKNHD